MNVISYLCASQRAEWTLWTKCSDSDTLNLSQALRVLWLPTNSGWQWTSTADSHLRAGRKHVLCTLAARIECVRMCWCIFEHAALSGLITKQTHPVVRHPNRHSWMLTAAIQFPPPLFVIPGLCCLSATNRWERTARRGEIQRERESAKKARR